MQVFNLDSIEAFPYEERDQNVFFKANEFKTRIINLSKGEKIPECEMTSYVIFIVIKGEVEAKINESKFILVKNQCLITEPAKVSMKTVAGARIVGIQVNKN
ncbi:MAG: hypothetical protein JW997_00925 [Actinobacteria bacterium]|nr:hypothetical protein [Actinomycetota bacterium]